MLTLSQMCGNKKKENAGSSLGSGKLGEKSMKYDMYVHAT